VQEFPLEEVRVRSEGTHSVDEMMKLVDIHAGHAHRTLKLSPETVQKIRSSLEKQTGL
jgi:predicted small metal-binding protein